MHSNQESTERSVRDQKAYDTMSDIHMENMAAGIKSVFESSKYSDLTIRCKGNEFKVHRNILCPRSTFFTAACDGEFKVWHHCLGTVDD